MVGTWVVWGGLLRGGELCLGLKRLVGFGKQVERTVLGTWSSGSLSRGWDGQTMSPGRDRIHAGDIGGDFGNHLHGARKCSGLATGSDIPVYHSLSR